MLRNKTVLFTQETMLQFKQLLVDISHLTNFLIYYSVWLYIIYQYSVSVSARHNSTSICHDRRINYNNYIYMRNSSNIFIIFFNI